MTAFGRLLVTSAVVLGSLTSEASAQGKPQPLVLYGTTGACNNVTQGGPCTETSTLVQLDASTGALVKTIGPVGFTVNGLAWDAGTKTLYATTPPGDTSFHGLITIDVGTGAGKPVQPGVVNFGLSVDPGSPGSPVHSIAIDSFGTMVGWYDEFPGPDTFVRINKRTGIATEFRATIDTSTNGLAFGSDILWNIDSPRGASSTQTAYVINPANGQVLAQRTLTPPTNAALGDFNPVDHLYYGLNFEPGRTARTDIVVVDPFMGTITTLGQSVDFLHVIAFVKPPGAVPPGRCLVE